MQQPTEKFETVNEFEDRMRAQHITALRNRTSLTMVIKTFADEVYFPSKSMHY